MNHPRLDCRGLSHEALLALEEALILDFYRLRDVEDAIGQQQAEAAKKEAEKIRRFLDR